MEAGDDWGLFHHRLDGDDLCHARRVWREVLQSPQRLGKLGLLEIPRPQAPELILPARRVEHPPNSVFLPVEPPRGIVYPFRMETMARTQEDRLRYAKVLVEIGQLTRAEHEVAEVLDDNPEHLEALSLFTKVKHMRGQLSLAVACSVQVQSRQTASGGQARMHLESMLHLAQDPTHGAGEFLAIGQFQLVQKPTAYLALEDAFRLFVARRPN